MTPILVRPHHVFRSFKTETLNDRIYKSVIPHPSNFSGGTTTLETAIILTLIKRSQPEYIFEFGTYMGSTTAIIALNTDDNVKIYTIDLPPACDPDDLTESEKEEKLSIARKSDQKEDAFLIERSTHVGPVILNGINGPETAKVTCLHGDSTTYDYKDYIESIDFIWVDGGHDYDIVKKDTENSFKMLNPSNKLATIAWHDYGNPACPGVTQYLDELSETHKIFRVGNTMLCFCCPYTENAGIEI